MADTAFVLTELFKFGDFVQLAFLDSAQMAFLDSQSDRNCIGVVIGFKRKSYVKGDKVKVAWKGLGVSCHDPNTLVVIGRHGLFDLDDDNDE